MALYKTPQGKFLKTPLGKLLGSGTNAPVTTTTSTSSSSTSSTTTTTSTIGEIPLTGSVFSTGNAVGANVPANVFDGILTTYFDSTLQNGAYVGLDLGTPKVITKVKYAPRSATLNVRMTGGKFQGSNTSATAGYVDLYTIPSAPPYNVLTEATVTNPTAFRYVRYLAPNGSYGNIGEAQFFGA